MTAERAAKFLSTLLISSTCLAAPVEAQRLLVIPDLSVGARVDTAAIQRRVRQVFLEFNPRATEEQIEAAQIAALEPSWLDFDAIGSMDPNSSNAFWGEADRSILPGASLGLGDGSATAYTEVGHVLTGSWRFAVGTTLSLETEAEEEGEETTDRNSGLERFIAGGGNLSFQGIRPLVRGTASTYNQFALLAIPRVWANLPGLSSAEAVDDFGGEAALSLLYQRSNNDLDPFLSFELRGGAVVGSDAFYQTIGHDEANSFLYAAPTLAISVVDQVNLAVSTFISSEFDNPGLRIGVSFLNKLVEADSGSD